MPDIVDRRRACATAGALLCALLATGCASVDASRPTREVQTQVAQRSGQALDWDAKAGTAHATTRTLLAQPLTGEAAVRLAMLNNREIQAQFERLGIAQADLVEAGLLDNPVFSLSLFYGSGTIAEAGVVQDLVGLLSLSARKRLGQAQADRLAADVAQRLVDIAAEVKARHATVVGDTQALELARQVQDATQAGAELAQRQYAAGNLSKRERDIQHALYAEAALESSQAQAQLNADREQLTRAMGLWGADAQWTTAPRLPEVPTQLPDLAHVESQAIAQRLDLQAARMETRASGMALDLTQRWRYLSALGVGVAFKRESNGDKFVGPHVELGLPLFNQGQTRVARARSEARRAEAQLAALAVEIRSQARAARDRLVAAQKAALHYRDVLLPLQADIVDETVKFHNGMLVGVYDLLLARQQQIHTAQRSIAATREFWLAWLDLERAIGAPLTAAHASTTEH